MQSMNETIRLNVAGKNLVPKSTGEGAETDKEAGGAASEGTTLEAADNGTGSCRRRKRERH